MGHPSVKANLFPPSPAPPAQMACGGEPALRQRLIPVTQFCLPVAMWVTCTAGPCPPEPVPHPPSPLWCSQFSGPCGPKNIEGGKPEHGCSAGLSVSPGSPCLCSCCTLCLKSPFPSFYSFFFFLIFGHTPQHVGPWFPRQGWNQCIGRWSLNSWASREVPLPHFPSQLSHILSTLLC